MEFLSEADVLLKTFWYIALGVSIVFLIQTVMTFAGMDGADGVDADFDGDMDTDADATRFNCFPSEILSISY